MTFADLENTNVETVAELGADEMEQVNGGGIFAIWGLFTLASVIGFGSAVAQDQL